MERIAELKAALAQAQKLQQQVSALALSIQGAQMQADVLASDRFSFAIRDDMEDLSKLLTAALADHLIDGSSQRIQRHIRALQDELFALEAVA